MIHARVLFLLVGLTFNAFALESEQLTTPAYFQLDPSKQSDNLFSAQKTKSSVYVIAATRQNTLMQNTGMGYQYQLSSVFMVNTSVQYQNNFILPDKYRSASLESVSRDAVVVETGTRVLVNPVFKLYSAFVYRLPKQTSGNELGLKLSGDYYFNRHISAGMHAQIIAENKIYGVHGSFHF